jgi:hypothetical protein
MLAGDDAGKHVAFFRGDQRQDRRGNVKGIATTNRETIVPVGLFPDGRLAYAGQEIKGRALGLNPREYLYLAIVRITGHAPRPPP